MPKGFLISMAIGLAVVGIFVGLVVYKQRGSTPRLVGEIASVRTLEMDESSSVAIVDLRVTNDSRLLFIVRETAMRAVDAKGEARQGRIISASDAKRLFELFPALGSISSEMLIIKTHIPASESRTMMLAARFEIPKADLDARKSITVSVGEVDGAVSELSR